jgi:hypothetical protein
MGHTHTVSCDLKIYCFQTYESLLSIVHRKVQRDYVNLPHYTNQAICIILLAAQEWMMNLKSMVPSLPGHIKWAEVKPLPCVIKCHAMTAYREVARQHNTSSPQGKGSVSRPEKLIPCKVYLVPTEKDLLWA